MKTFEAGTVVELEDGRQIDIKEYKVDGMYEGHNIANFQKVYFGREEVKRVIKRPKVLIEFKAYETIGIQTLCPIIIDEEEK